MFYHVSDREMLEGYVVDIACLRKWLHRNVPEKARAHTRQCSLEGHCLESGFGLVDEAGNIALLDPEATPRIAEAVKQSSRDQGIRLRVERESRDSRGVTTKVEEIPDLC